jgi:S-(hydroxymethyl)glutathione dehydrogenase/alcohol dehydrogenase
MAGKINLDELISQRYKLDGINEAFDVLRSGEAARGVVVF